MTKYEQVQRKKASSPEGGEEPLVARQRALCEASASRLQRPLVVDDWQTAHSASAFAFPVSRGLRTRALASVGALTFL